MADAQDTLPNTEPAPAIGGPKDVNVSGGVIASREAIYDALLVPENFSAWISPLKTPLDPTVGAEFAVRPFNPSAAESELKGKFLELDRPNRIRFELNSRDVPTEVTIAMRDSDGKTVVKIAQEGFRGTDGKDPARYMEHLWRKLIRRHLKRNFAEPQA